ncbi:MAG: thioesterase family protein [Ilumatobacteraceae bacterium]
MASQLLDQPFAAHTPIPEQLWGFGGVHGGLALAIVTNSMISGTDRPVRSVTGQFLRPTRAEIVVAVDPDDERVGRVTQVRSGSVWSGDQRSIRAVSVLGTHSRDAASMAPAMPSVPRPEDCAVYDVPVPFGRSIELRPTDDARPYAGRSDAVLTAWIRLRDDDTPIDLARLIMLSDALAPSYSATVTEMLVVPTVELNLRPSAALAGADSPWLLVHATTTSVSSDGWVAEHIDTFSPSGAHLGAADQLRVIRQV